MKENTVLKSVLRGLTIALASVLTLSVGMAIGAKQNESDINSYLGTSNVTTEKSEDAKYTSEFDSWQDMVAAKHENIAQVTSEGIVLLKNENSALPLSTNVATKLNIFGRNSADPVYGGGGGAGRVTDSNVIDVRTAFNNYGIEINDTLYDWYSTQEQRAVGGRTSDNFSVGEVNPADFPDSVESTFKDYDSTAIIWLARCIGEGTDPAPGFMELTSEELALIEYVKDLDYISKIIVVLNEDNTMGVGPLAEDPEIDAIIHAGGFGINGTESLVKILYGEVNPSGHLTDTYAASSLSSAAAQNMYDYTLENKDAVENYVGGSLEYATSYIAMKEGIYVGYRYYETRYEDALLNPSSGASGNYGIYFGESNYGDTSEWKYEYEVSYPFGHGLSYTTFSQTLDSLTVEDNMITATVTVRNTGSVAGKAVVQLYAQSPYTDYDKQYLVEKSSIQLLNFAKTDTLQGGAETQVTITCSTEFLASYDYTEAKGYILDEGTYYFAIGDDAHDALNNVIAQKVTDNESDYSSLDVDGLKNLGDTSQVKSYYYEVSGEGVVDSSTYRYSTETTNEVTNLFDDADYNYFEGAQNKYVYLTRQDWSTFPTSADEDGSGLLAATDKMMQLLSGQEALNPDYDYSNGDYDDVTEVTVNSGTDYDLSVLYYSDDYDDPLWDTVLSQMSWEEMTTFTQGNSLTRPIESIGYMGSVDGDGPAGFSGTFGDETTNPDGLTARVYQSQCTLASTWNQALASRQGEFMGEDGLWLGKTSIWAPGMNLHRTPYSARNFEYYSEDSMMAYWMGARQSKGIQDKGCIACPKHYAFNDQEKNRCSLINFFNEQSGRELQLRSFQGSFTIGEAMGTMTTFSRIGCTYGGASWALLTGVLRNEWGFEGYTITDYAAWQFQHAIESLKAGTDLFDTTASTYSDVILEEVLKDDGDIVTQAALREANKRVLYAYVNSNAIETTYTTVLPWWESAIYAAIGVLSGLTLISLVACAAVTIISRKRKDDGQN